ncbi:hypothetical protein PVAP13_3KG498903 [Panicum virgatum]|uniref:Uncharacterized protein n=1 Tax=Panicum virgatum TaxID=38727 RepID=A0A8T0V712_PANVG|nr:hypothetical protein PVAP13_3KG498903 [Panicum virgatum]
MWLRPWPPLPRSPPARAPPPLLPSLSEEDLSKRNKLEANRSSIPLFSISIMADPPLPSQSPAQTPPQPAPGAGGREDMLACVAVLLLCLPARELQTVDRSLQSSHQRHSVVIVCDGWTMVTT